MADGFATPRVGVSGNKRGRRSHGLKAVLRLEVNNMHEFIRGKVAMLDKAAAASMKILYGGSVNPQNAVQLFVMQDIDGGLIGKCSLNAQEFEGICRAVG